MILVMNFGGLKGSKAVLLIMILEGSKGGVLLSLTISVHISVHAYLNPKP
jgi:hypothetical protein